MAENRNGDFWEDELSEDSSAVFGGREREVRMPPRNILETDSAKYTAEFVKGVVKGLYTADERAYDRNEDYGDYAPEPVSRGSESSYGEPIGGNRARGESERAVERVKRPAFEYAPEPEEIKPEPVKARAPREAESVSETTGFRPEAKREREKPRSRESAFNMSEEEVLAADGFLKAYEEKNRQDKASYVKKPARRTFSSLHSEDNAAEMENVLSGKPPKRRAGIYIGDEEEEYVYIKKESGTRGVRQVDSGQPENETVFRRVSQSGPETEEKDGYTFVPAYEEIPSKQEKIPIIINKKIESKPKKTAEDYKGMGKNDYNSKPLGRVSGSPAIPFSGANIFAVVFMIAAVVIIGLLVWKVNSLSKGTEQGDADEIVSLREQNSLLAQRSDEWERKYNEVLGQYEASQEEIRILNEELEASRQPESEETLEQPESAPSADGLTDGYYTVQRGDTLWKISEQYLGSGDRYNEIATLNNLDSASSLYAGLKLKIPVR